MLASLILPRQSLLLEGDGGGVGAAPFLQDKSQEEAAVPQSEEPLEEEHEEQQPLAAIAPAKPLDYTLHITVSDPIRQGDGINSFIAYKVCTQTTLPEQTTDEEHQGRVDVAQMMAKLAASLGSSSTNSRQELPHTVRSEVLRRYSDFVWLVQKLANAYPGCIVPPLPEKLLVGRFSPEFVESRRRALEKFLTRVVQHPDLIHSKDLALFLVADDEGLRLAKEEFKAKMVPPPKKMVELINTAMNTMQYKTFQTSGDLDKSPHDPTFEEITAYINQLEAQLQTTLKHSTILVKKRKELANALSDFGVSATVLGQCEKSLAESLMEVGKVSDSLSALGNAEAEKEGIQFEDSLAEYCRLVASVKVALQKRQEARIAYGCALFDLETKRNTYNRLVGMAAAKAERISAAEAAYVRAQEIVNEAEEELDVVSQRFLRDFDSFKTEKSTKLKKIMLSFVTLQADYHKTVEKAWINLVPRLQAGDGSVAAHTSSEASITDTTTTATSNKPPLDKEEVAAIKPRHPIAVMKASPVYMQMLIVGALSVGAMVLSSRVGRR